MAFFSPHEGLTTYVCNLANGWASLYGNLVRDNVFDACFFRTTLSGPEYRVFEMKGWCSGVLHRGPRVVKDEVGRTALPRAWHTARRARSNRCAYPRRRSRQLPSPRCGPRAARWRAGGRSRGSCGCPSPTPERLAPYARFLHRAHWWLRRAAAARVSLARQTLLGLGRSQLYHRQRIAARERYLRRDQRRHLPSWRSPLPITFSTTAVSFP